MNDDRLTRSYPANYDAHARSVPPDAHWKQVRRTVDGEPVDAAQIGFIVEAIAAGLDLARTDVVLDLACGNGALSSRLFDRCAGLVGVDISPYLIEIAQKDFGRLPNSNGLFYPENSHMNSKGEAIIAQAIVEQITDGRVPAFSRCSNSEAIKLAKN